MSHSPPIHGLDSPPRPSLDSPPRPARARPHINLFFPSPVADPAPAAAAAGSYTREGQVPAVYTRTARGVWDDDDDEGDEAPSPKRQRPAPAPGPASSAAQSSALALFDDLERSRPAAAQQETFDPLMGPVGMMADGDDPAAVGAGATTGGEAGKRRVMPKMDVERLLGDRGFPALIKDAKRFRVRGKGHEGKDLANLLSMYQLWAHQMYPKMAFGDTVTKVEALCGTNVAKNALRGYREREREIKEALFRSPTPPPSSSLSHQQQQAATTTPSGVGETGTTTTTAAAAAAEANPLPPAASPSYHHHDGHDEDEEEDYEAMIAAAEAEAEEAQRALAASSTRTTSGPGKRSSITAVGREESRAVGDSNADDDDDDDGFPPPDFEHEVEMAMATDTAAPAAVAARTNAVGHAQGGEDEYEDDWAAMDGL